MNRLKPETASDFRDVFAGLRGRLRLVVLCVVVAGGAALGFSLLQEDKYTAGASLLFRDPGFDQQIFGAPVFQAGLDPAREAATNLELVSLDVVGDATAEDLREHDLTGPEVTDSVTVEQKGESDVVTVAATDPDPELATQLANTFARNFIEFRQDADRAKVKEAMRLVRARLREVESGDQGAAEPRQLRDQLSQLTTLRALQAGNAELVQPATTPEDPSSPNTIRNTALGAILGLSLGVGLALLLERLNRRVRDPDELEDLYSLPVLASVPESERLLEEPEGSDEPLPFREAEAFRMLRSRLRYFNVDRDIRSVVITSARPGEGKSTIAWNLAITAAATGLRTLLIEADLHKSVFAESSTELVVLPGLAEVLTKQSSFSDAVQTVSLPDRTNGSEGNRELHVSEGNRELHVLVAGGSPPNAAELLESEEMAHLLEQASSSFDFVVLDTPPAILADAIPLMRRATGVIIVGRLGLTTRDEVRHLKEQLERLDVSALGVVANRVTAQDSRYGYGYYTRYDG